MYDKNIRFLSRIYDSILQTTIYYTAKPPSLFFTNHTVKDCVIIQKVYVQSKVQIMLI